MLGSSLGEVGMRWASIVSVHESTSAAVDEVCAGVVHALGSSSPQLLLVYVTAHHQSDYATVVSGLRSAFPDAQLLGCSAASVIGDGHEIEGVAAISLTAAVLPDVEIVAFELRSTDAGAPPVFDDLAAHVGVDPDLAPAFVLLTDPFTVRADVLGHTLDVAYPGSPKIGGLASGGGEPGSCALFLGDRVLTSGAVGIALTGDLEMVTVVAQGCLPVGADMRVTGMEGHLVTALDGMNAFARLEKAIGDLDVLTRSLLTRGPMIGVAMNPAATTLNRGDYLVRQLVGGDPKRGALAIAHPLKLGDIVRLHVRDAASSTEDLRELLARQPREQPEAALIFSCVGRGREFHGEPDYDVRAVRAQFGPIPVGGFFCNGELGPVHGQTFLHSWTSAMGLIRAREWS